MACVIGAVDDKRSASGSCTFVGGNLITWKTKGQKFFCVFQLSSAEAEYRAMAYATCELIWLKQLREELCYPTHAEVLLH